MDKKFTPHPRKLFGKEWTTDCQTAFHTLTEHLVTAPILSYAKFDESFILETDASMQGLGAVLSQLVDEQLRVVEYTCRALRPNERNMDNYSSRKLKLLALTWAITDKFRDYLLRSTLQCLQIIIRCVIYKHRNLVHMNKDSYFLLFLLF